ncbi:MAG: carboxypeptidase regulatory-like domain-containing protein [Myxococcales bacterium]|nr:carboxypeptidase regulatory-like domain-containing protein [Myxococcales bacterium]
MKTVHAATLLSLLLSTGVAAAQKAPSQAAAQALFEEGRRLMTAGRYGDACPKLAESQRLDPGAGTLLNLAACYEKNGQTASAWATYKETISEAEKSNRREWAAKARQRALALEPTLVKLSIVVPPSARSAGLVIKRDGSEVGAGEWGVAIPVDPGSHNIEASAPGYKPWTTVAQAVRAKETATVSIPQLERLPPATQAVATATPPARGPVGAAPLPGPETPDGAPSGSTQRTLGFVAGGVGVAGLAVGAIFGLQAMSARKDAEPDCSSDLARCNQKGLDAVDDAKGKALISTVGFAAGGALVATGLVLVLTAPRNREASALTLNFSPRGALLSGGFQ